MNAREVSGNPSIPGPPKPLELGFDKRPGALYSRRSGLRSILRGPAPPLIHLIRAMPELLDKEDIKKQLKKIPEWDLDGNKLTRSLEFDGFEEAVDFVNDVAEIAEKFGHHPDIDIRYNKVLLALTTHDAGGLTEDDFSVAGAIDHAIG